jgi:hypothetical protein
MSFIALPAEFDQRHKYMSPVEDSTRRPIDFPRMTLTINFIKAFVFILELWEGEAFILRWAFVPAELMTPHGFITTSTMGQLT